MRKSKHIGRKGRKEGGENDRIKNEDVIEQKYEFTLPNGSAFKLNGLAGLITREDIKEVLDDDLR